MLFNVLNQKLMSIQKQISNLHRIVDSNHTSSYTWKVCAIKTIINSHKNPKFPIGITSYLCYAISGVTNTAQIDELQYCWTNNTHYSFWCPLSIANYSPVQLYYKFTTDWHWNTVTNICTDRHGHTIACC